MASKNGVSKKAARTAYNSLKKEIANLETHMNALVKDVEEMNEKYLYGGEEADQWYKKVCGHYSTNKGSLVKFHTGLTNFEREMRDVFAKASSKGISF